MHVSNRYRLIEPLGEGGMGVVWRAYDELLDRTVAIKEVRYTGVGEAKRAELNRRTIREARAAGRLDHPSVVVIHDVVEEDGRPWIVMQLVRSRSLAQVIGESGPLRPAQVAVIGGRVLDALRAAHATGVLHRDVKPENVLLGDDGRVVLTDFGIASMEAEAGLTATGGLVGTPAYMPPERLNGDPARPESDLWSLGATLYAAVEGRPPFKRDSWAATVAAVLRDEPEPPVRAGVLEPVIMGLLRRDPGARLPAAEAAALLYEAASAPPSAPPSVPHAPHAPHAAVTGAPAQPAGAGPVATPPTGGPATPPLPWQQSGGGTHPGGAPYTTMPEQRGRPGRGRRKAVWIGVPLAVAAVAVLGTGGVLLSDRWTAASPTGEPTSQPATAPATEPTTAPTTGPTTGPTAGPSPEPATTTPRPTRTAPPAGWRSYRSALGRFQIAMPAGWKPAKTQGRDSISFKGPDTPGMMIVEWTVPDIPWDDPERHWRGLEKEIQAKGEFQRYQRIGITPTGYLGVKAADWEFTRVRDGQTIHVINRGFHTKDGRPYALYWETPHSRWARDRHYFDTFVKTFRPL
ncbi:serine/threonine-protein kinase [Nonomuraea gerenzanensis]|uniref:serine/threonine-protein kinase n=1 Tax=Nonomuraea gerenzanensis TaxID=93944 RepID=UPI001CDA2475|nr:serine/threonine-protein kinase [Nonomuraea gerenzanensis]UBU16929.1 serine/threonine protein kinase [Nonomuraea gerenzanensis]